MKTAKQDFVTQAQDFIDNINDNTVIKEYRQDNYKLLEKNGLPTIRHEDWKYTDFDHILHNGFDLDKDHINKKDIKYDDDLIINIKSLVGNYITNNGFNHVLLFIDGNFSPDLSIYNNKSKDGLDNGLDVRVLSDFSELSDLEIINKSEKLFKIDNSNSQINSIVNYINSTWHDGLYVNIKNQTEHEKIILLYLNSSRSHKKVINYKNIINVGENCTASVTEEYLSISPDNKICDSSENTSFNNFLNEINMLEGSSCYHYLLQNQNTNNYHLSFYYVNQSMNSSYNNYNFNIGSKLSRQEIIVNKTGDNSECNLTGLYIANNRQHMDSHLKIHHNASFGTSKQNYRGILTDRAHGVFNGMVYIKEHTSNNNADQNNKNILLSDNCEVDTKPELQVYSEDVVCSHGATIGKLDKESLFYLRSRGIPYNQAKHLLLSSFVTEIVKNIDISYVSTWLNNNLIEKLNIICSD